MSPVIKVFPLQMPWTTTDPFLFCVHHEDHYPRGNGKLGPGVSLGGRAIGSDFSGKDGWSMYHGKNVPGFPAHPHSGFETVTIAVKGYIDHSDSLGAAGRFGGGDVQWMTAGRGVQHSEMFPLIREDAENPVELFQIWLNLPRKSKKADPHFAMLWKGDIPVYKHRDEAGRSTWIDLIAGRIENTQAPDPAPNSWAADPENETAIWTIKMEPGARFTLPTASAKAKRNLYFYRGGSISVAGGNLPLYHGAGLKADIETELINGNEASFLLLLQSRPIEEPVVQYGPFVANSQAEIEEAMDSFRRGEFGDWPWSSMEHTHAPESGRFAKYADGSVLEP